MRVERKFNTNGDSFEQMFKAYARESADAFMKSRRKKQSARGGEN